MDRFGVINVQRVFLVALAIVWTALLFGCVVQLRISPSTDYQVIRWMGAVGDENVG